jgi:hypothetical protein
MWVIHAKGTLRVLIGRYQLIRLCRFKSVVAEIDETNIPDYLRQYTDAHRVHMFDIIMQFRAIFYDGGDCAPTEDVSATTGGSSGRSGGQSGASGEGARSPVSPVLASWAHGCMETFIDRLDTLLPSYVPHEQMPASFPVNVPCCMHSQMTCTGLGRWFAI